MRSSGTTWKGSFWGEDEGRASAAGPAGRPWGSRGRGRLLPATSGCRWGRPRAAALCPAGAWGGQGPADGDPCPGLLCHLNDACISNPCNEGSNCDTNPVNGKAICTCPSGYTGPACSQDVDECSLGACRPGSVGTGAAAGDGLCPQRGPGLAGGPPPWGTTPGGQRAAPPRATPSPCHAPPHAAPLTVPLPPHARRQPLRAQRQVHQHAGLLRVPVSAGLHRAPLRDRRQRVRLEPVSERRHLLGPDRGVPVHLYARCVAPASGPTPRELMGGWSGVGWGSWASGRSTGRDQAWGPLGCLPWVAGAARRGGARLRAHGACAAPRLRGRPLRGEPRRVCQQPLPAERPLPGQGQRVPVRVSHR